MLRPSAEESPNCSSPQLRAATDKAITKSCSLITENFFCQEVISLLFRPKLDAAVKELKHIVESAGQLSYKLWARRNHIMVAGLPDLKVNQYRAGSDCVDHHALHNNYLECDPYALDGKPIILMLSPLITVNGGSDGCGFEAERIWKKAIAFMGLPKEEKSTYYFDGQRSSADKTITI